MGQAAQLWAEGTSRTGCAADLPVTPRDQAAGCVKIHHLKRHDQGISAARAIDGQQIWHISLKFGVGEMLFVPGD
jgi:hypothetical protein